MKPLSKHKDDNQTNNNDKKKTFWQKHKTKIRYGCFTILGGVACIILYKNRDNIIEIISTLDSFPKNMNHDDAVDQIKKASDSIKKVVPDDLELTGNRFTAQDLGSKMSCDAREINRRIIDAGLAKRLPCGDLVFTEEGKALGERTYKTTKWDYTFSNIEWDETIIPLIFNEKERAVAEEKWARKQEILNSLKPL